MIERESKVKTKANTKKKLLIAAGVVVVALAAALVFISNYLVNYAIGRSGNGGDRRPAPRPKREEKPRVWQPKPAAPQGEMSFEDMMARYKTRSEEKIADLKRVTENHRGGYSRRRG